MATTTNKKGNLSNNKGRGNSSSQKSRKSSNQKSLLSKIIKGSKGQKGKRIPFKNFYEFGTKVNKSVERLNKCVLIALKHARLPARQIEAGRRVIKKFIRKNYRLKVHVYPFAPITKRPSDVRMGKGKGTKISDWIYPLKAGKILYEITPKRKRIRFKRLNLYKITMVRALRLAQVKFAFPTVVRLLRE